jgi:Na+:H+ antiporter, NhaA family
MELGGPSGAKGRYVLWRIAIPLRPPYRDPPTGPERQKADRASSDLSEMRKNEGLPKLVLPVEGRDNCLGSPSALHTLVEYGDYTSVHCRNVAGVVNELVREFQGDLCFVFRNFPQPTRHALSRRAADAAEAAGLQGKFWLMHDRLFAHQDVLSEKLIREIAGGLPVEMEDFERDLSTGAAARRVEEDLESAEEAGVGDTPTFFVNGVLQVGQYEFLPLLNALRASARKPGEAALS